MLQALHQQGPVRQPSQGIVKRDLARAVGGLPEIGPSLRVHDVRGGDVCQGLGCFHRCRAELAPPVPVKVQGAYPAVTEAQREREHRSQAGFGRPGYEQREPLFAAEIGYRDGSAGTVRLQAGPVLELGL